MLTHFHQRLGRTGSKAVGQLPGWLHDEDRIQGGCQWRLDTTSDRVVLSGSLCRLAYLHEKRADANACTQGQAGLSV